MAGEWDRHGLSHSSFHILVMCFTLTLGQVAATPEIRVLTPNVYQYWYLTKFGIPSQESTHLAFKVQACNDAHMLLKPSNRRPIEIVLGGWSNSNSCLRTRVQGPCRDQYDGNILDCKEFKEFVISWKDGNIMVGHMNSGFRDLMLDFQLKKPLSNVTIGISTGFGATGIWTFEDTRTNTTDTTVPSVPVTSTDKLTTNEGSQNAQVINVEGKSSEMTNSYTAVGATAAVLALLAFIVVGAILWRRLIRRPGPSPNIEIINPGFNGKEMSTYEIIHNHYPEENLYTDIGTLDIAKVHENGAYYDTAEPLEDKNMYLRMLDASSEEMQRTSNYLSTSNTKQPSKGRSSNTKQQTEDGQANYYVDIPTLCQDLP
uniref:Farnesoic acid O-methyl transferase domain-containing protein n=1 Tax=Magallana gigas TaxID=29159 RepID=A0A8W8JPY5_MAGGI